MSEDTQKIQSRTAIPLGNGREVPLEEVLEIENRHLEEIMAEVGRKRLRPARPPQTTFRYEDAWGPAVIITTAVLAGPWGESA